MINYRIHFIACGKAENPKKYVYMGKEDFPLSEEGKAEILLLKKKFMFPDVEMIYSSPLKRCTQTAELLYPDKFCVFDDNMIEFNMGVLQGKSMVELEKSSHFKKFLERGLSHTIPGGENGEEFSLRCVKAVKNIFTNMMREKMGSVAVITHPGVIMYLLSAIGLPKIDFKTQPILPGTGYTTLASPQLWMNSGAIEIYSHLPYQLMEDDTSL